MRSAGAWTLGDNLERLVLTAGASVDGTGNALDNVLTGNAFVGNRMQVKYVGSRHMEWSHDGHGNYWSDHPAFDLNGDGIADGVFRPNDMMDQILWSQPAASLLIGAGLTMMLTRTTGADVMATATSALTELGAEWDVVQLQASRSQPILDMHRMAAQNPVWIVSANKEKA